jgi:hypothetical protein
LLNSFTIPLANINLKIGVISYMSLGYKGAKIIAKKPASRSRISH